MDREAGEERVALCGANAYDKKYYFNEKFAGLPASIKEELRIISVLFTEEAGGIFTIEFEKDDFLYDEIGSGLLVGEIRRKRQEMFESLSLYYRVFILHEDPAGLLAGAEKEP